MVGYDSFSFLASAMLYLNQRLVLNTGVTRDNCTCLRKSTHGHWQQEGHPSKDTGSKGHKLILHVSQ